jgi:magnesium-transporting ATPase (P-type)
MENETKNWITIALVIFMFLSLIVVFLERFITKKGVGARTIQIIGVLLIVPLIGILSLYEVLDKQTTATLIGALTGYLLSGVGSYTPSSKTTKNEKKQN